MIRGTRAGFTILHSNRGRSPNNITALLFRPLIPCPIRKIFSTNLPNFCSEISGDFYPIFHHKIFDKNHYKISVPCSGGRFGTIGSASSIMTIHIYIYIFSFCYFPLLDKVALIKKSPYSRSDKTLKHGASAPRSSIR